MHTYSQREQPFRWFKLQYLELYTSCFFLINFDTHFSRPAVSLQPQQCVHNCGLCYCRWEEFCCCFLVLFCCSMLQRPTMWLYATLSFCLCDASKLLGSCRTWISLWSLVIISTSMPVGVGWSDMSYQRRAPVTAFLTFWGTSWKLSSKVSLIIVDSGLQHPELWVGFIQS